MTGGSDRDLGERGEPNTLPCADCGHVWFAGERRHAHFAHGSGDPARGVVLCVLCLQKRELGHADSTSQESWI